MKEISSFDEIKEVGRYSLKDKTKNWLMIIPTEKGLTVRGSFKPNVSSEGIYITKAGTIKIFKTIDSIIKYLIRCSKLNYWNLRDWHKPKPTYEERLLCEDAKVVNIDKYFLEVKSSRGTDFIRLGVESPSDSKIGDEGSLHYVKTTNAGLIHFRKKS
jgi:hypothetical protein